MKRKESYCQRELSRSTKTPQSVHRNALLYVVERGNAYTSLTPENHKITMKQEPLRNIKRQRDVFVTGQESFEEAQRGRMLHAEGD